MRSVPAQVPGVCELPVHVMVPPPWEQDRQWPLTPVRVTPSGISRVRRIGPVVPSTDALTSMEVSVRGPRTARCAVKGLVVTDAGDVVVPDCGDDGVELGTGATVRVGAGAVGCGDVLVVGVGVGALGSGLPDGSATGDVALAVRATEGVTDGLRDVTLSAAGGVTCGPLTVPIATATATLVTATAPAEPSAHLVPRRDSTWA